MQHPFDFRRKFVAAAAVLVSLLAVGEGARADKPTIVATGEGARGGKTNNTLPPNNEGAARAPLWPVRVVNINTQESVSARLYDGTTKVDKTVAAQLDDLLCDARDPSHHRSTMLDRRALQLLYRAAYHFRVREVEVVSAYRKPGRKPEGRHGEGRAIDFRLPKVRAATLAAYLRTMPRVGVGLYTHRATQFVHLDVRERSYHWLDPSPPGVSLPEKPLASRELGKYDATYAPTDDLPEAGVAEPPSDPNAEQPAAPTASTATDQRADAGVESVAAAPPSSSPELAPGTAQKVAQILALPSEFIRSEEPVATRGH